MAEKRDYYEVLGVAKNCGEDELKKAYRRRAKECHPDLHPGDHEAEEAFKEVNEAYGVLSDPEKRSRYDQFGFDGVDGQGYRNYNASDFGFDLNDILNTFFGGFGGFGGAQRSNPNAPRRGANLKYRMTLEFLEAAFGTKREINFSREGSCSHCHGSGAEPGTEVKTCPTCHGSGQVAQQQQTLFGLSVVSRPCGDCGGTGKIIATPCNQCHGRGREEQKRKLDVTVPAGIDQGEMLTLRGEGEAGYNGGPDGDLYIEVSIKPHDVFERRGYNVYCDVPITFAQAALGKEIAIPTIHGTEKYTLKEGTQPGDLVTLRNKGIPVINRPGQFGDLVAHFTIEVPRQLNDEQKELLSRFDEACDEKNYRKRVSFLDRLKNLFN